MDLVLQKTVNGVTSNVAKAPTITGSGEGPFTYTWENLPTKEGNDPITYSVKESDGAGGTVNPGGTVTINGRDYTVTYNGNNVVNTAATASTTKFIATKTWVGGPAGDHTAVDLVLQKTVNGVTSDVVKVPTITGSGEGPFTYTWENLPTKEAGQTIIYSVKESNGSGGTFNQGDTVTVNGRDYTVTYNGNNVVNSTDANTPPSPGGFGGTGGPGEPIDITAKKVWDDSKAEESVNHPTIWFKLYRSLRGSMEPVPGAEIKALTPGVTEVTWHGIEKVNASGETYTFEVKEVDATGFDLC